jgi:hypothetical protein
VSLSLTQIFTAATAGAIAADQAQAGHRSDLLITGAITGVGSATANEVSEVAGVASVEPIVASSVLIRGNQPDASWQSLSALAVEGDQVERYADLQPVGSTTVRLAGRPGLGAPPRVRRGSRERRPRTRSSRSFCS